MSKNARRRSRKAGMPPGALVHIGERKATDVRIAVLQYDEAGVVEKSDCGLEKAIALDTSQGVTWVNLAGLHEPEILARLGSRFSLHPLTIEDILNTEQRPKLEVFDEYVFIVLKVLGYDSAGNVDVDQLSIVLGDRYVVSFEEREGRLFDTLKERLRLESSRLRRMGADFLAYAIIDAVVDSYFQIMEDLGDKIELLEDRALGLPVPKTMQAMQGLRRQMIAVRKAIWPLREVISVMERHESTLIRPDTVIYLRDVYDHVIQIMDTVETYKEMMSGMTDIYLSSLSNRTNDVMKVLTIIATIFIPLTFIAGVYGMNFQHMPELEQTWTYPALLGVMAALGIGMLGYFKRRGWW